MFWLSLLGCVLFVEGIPYFLSPKTVKQVALQVVQMKESTLRAMGLGLLLFGLFLVFLATQFRG